jgi:hypothetical protein
MDTTAKSTVGVAPTNTKKFIDPRWYAWSAKHADEHRDCDQAHDRTVFASGFLIGSGASAELAAQINPAFHDAVRLLLLSLAANEAVSESAHALVEEQTGDVRLWLEPITTRELLLQSALRRLQAAVQLAPTAGEPT